MKPSDVCMPLCASVCGCVSVCCCCVGVWVCELNSTSHLHTLKCHILHAVCASLALSQHSSPSVNVKKPPPVTHKLH